jgi:2-methylisocitrate lyase-like PEP mutase family enzyme
MPNAWDMGSARILERLGFKALATTSSGMAFGFGMLDGTISPEETFRHCADIASATSLPVSADLREGFGDSPDEVYKTIIAAAEKGVVGGSIEDWNNAPGAPKYEESLAVERIKAAAHQPLKKPPSNQSHKR